VNEGVELRRAGRDREALEKFKDAAKIRETPKVIAQIGFAEQALGLWLAAQGHLERTAAVTGDHWIDANRKTIDAALQLVNGHVGRIEVWGTPVGAEVVLDGEVVGKLPLPEAVRVAQEHVNLEVKAEGFLPLTRVINIQLGAMSREAVALRKVPAPSSLSARPSQPQAIPQAAKPDPVPEADDAPIYKKWWIWTAVGVAVAGGATAFFLIRPHGNGSSCPTSATCGTWSALRF